ncbi:restriction modification system DNA specificity domain [Clostridium sp. CAG:813]|nr:restriction modification system DNA specificity domain [Clostridium sp. CAG:813]
MAVNVVKLGDVATISAGQSAPKSNYFCEEGIPFVRAGSLEFLERGESIDLCEKISEDNAQICRLKLYPKNSILFAKSGMSANKGRIYKLERSAYIVSHLAIITPDETKLIPEYLMYWLQKHPPKTLIKDESYPSIGLTDIANMEIELPPLDYQKKIAKILDKADEIRAKKKLANDKLDEFLKSTYIDLFAENTKKVKLEELCYFITKGTTPKAQDMSQDSGDIPYIKVYNLRFDTRLDFTINPTFVTKESHKNFLARSVVYPGDVLMNIVGPPLCKVSIVPDTYPEWNINQAIARFRCNKGLNNLYLAWFLTTPFAEKQMLRNAKKTSGQLNLTLEICKNIEIPLPSLELQNKFAKIVEKVEAQKQKNELVIEQMNNLFNSLSQRAFKGGL